MRIVILGNEHVKGDEGAVKLSEVLRDELCDFEFVHIKSSFELVDEINNSDSIVIIDVVRGLVEPRLLDVSDLKVEGINSAHDFDAAFFLKLMCGDKKVRIVGIPQEGDFVSFKDKVVQLIKAS